MLAQVEESEQNLRRAHNELEQRVIERTLQLEQEMQTRQGQNEVLEQLATGQGLTRVLTTLVEITEQRTSGMRGSILLLDDTQRLRHCTAPRLPAAYTDAIDGVEIGPEVGSCGTAAFTKKLSVAENTQTDPHWQKYKELAGKHNLLTCWSVPVIASTGEVLGTFALYGNVPQEPDSEEIKLLEATAHLAGIAIEQKHAEQQLRLAKRTSGRGQPCQKRIPGEHEP